MITCSRFFQITDICQVSSQVEENGKLDNVDDSKQMNGHSSSPKPDEMKPSSNPNALICLDEAEAAAEQLDGFTLDDLNDEVFRRFSYPDLKLGDFLIPTIVAYLNWT